MLTSKNIFIFLFYEVWRPYLIRALFSESGYVPWAWSLSDVNYLLTGNHLNSDQGHKRELINSRLMKLCGYKDLSTYAKKSYLNHKIMEKNVIFFLHKFYNSFCKTFHFYLDLTWINSFLRLHCQNKINKKDFNR